MVRMQNIRTDFQDIVLYVTKISGQILTSGRERKSASLPPVSVHKGIEWLSRSQFELCAYRVGYWNERGLCDPLVWNTENLCRFLFIHQMKSGPAGPETSRSRGQHETPGCGRYAAPVPGLSQRRFAVEPVQDAWNDMYWHFM
jgi:hypothetical protein